MSPPALPPLPPLSAEQRVVYDKIIAFSKRREGRKTLTFGGYAGTGKTLLIAHLLRALDAKVCAFTGKAAHVLNSRGVPATTIHSLIYYCFAACEDCGKGETSCKCKGPPPKATRFAKVNDLGTKFVIVDEASMVTRKLMEDLQSFRGVKVLYVGDHGQLEPVGDDPKLMLDPELRLETIHRQAEGSPIIQFAHHVRQGFEPKSMGPGAEVRHGCPDDLTPYDIIICGFNKTRVAVNAKVRRQLGYEGPLPLRDERVICLRNSRDHEVFNGMLATVTRCDEATMDVVDDVGVERKKLPIDSRQFGSEKTLQGIKRDVTLWDFGYCLTAHKSQASQWDRVLVLDQVGSMWAPERWRYTAASRAILSLTYCMSNGRTR